MGIRVLRIVTGAVALLLGLLGTANAVEVGDAAPNFKAKAAGAGEIDLASFRGRWVVLFFYPKADTPGCTRQSCSLRDGVDAITRLNAAVLGISLDSLGAQESFRTKHSLPFPLVADSDKVITKAYDNLAIGGLVSRRRTFIIDPQGRIAHIFDRVDVNRHDAEVAQVLTSLQAAKP